MTCAALASAHELNPLPDAGFSVVVRGVVGFSTTFWGFGGVVVRGGAGGGVVVVLAVAGAVVLAVVLAVVVTRGAAPA